jgi:putative ABC transport system permease protein
MIMRHLERQPLRSALSCLGIALSIGILIMGNFITDTVDYIMDFQFSLAQRQALMVTFFEPTSGRSIQSLEHLPGVMHVEPFRSVPIRLVHGPRSRRLSILGLPRDSTLFRVFDAHEQQLVMPEEGLVISKALAEILDVRVGQKLQVEVLEAARPERQVPVVGLVEDFTDLNAYMEIGTLQRLMREQAVVSGAFIAVDAVTLDKLYLELKQTPRVAGVTIKQAMLTNFRQTLAENLLRMRTVNVMFAAVVAFGVVYNCARISLSERSRELATLRVLGFTRRETSFILLGELGVLVAIAIPLGMLIGYLLAYWLVTSLATEVHRFPLIISSATYAFAISVTLLASIMSALVVRQRIDRFDLVAVLKARD